MADLCSCGRLVIAHTAAEFVRCQDPDVTDEDIAAVEAGEYGEVEQFDWDAAFAAMGLVRLGGER